MKPMTEQIKKILRQKIKNRENINEWLIQFTPLTNLDLSHAIMDGINLSERDISGSNLKCARMRHAKCHMTKAQDCNMRFAILDRSQWIGADLRNSNLTNASGVQMIAQYADLRNCNACNFTFTVGDKFWKKVRLKKKTFGQLFEFTTVHKED